MPEIVGADREHDCLSRVRYRYRLASGLSEEVVGAISAHGPAEVRRYDARQLLPASRVLVQIEYAEGFLLQGAIGLDHLTVTFRKGDRLQDWKDVIEASIRQR